MRGRLEKAYHRQRDSGDDQSLIGDTIADLDAVLRIFSSLTRIAQVRPRNERRVPHREPGRNRQRVVELYDAAAEQDGTRLTLVGDREVLVTGDRDLIFDAIANLVDNASQARPHRRTGRGGERNHRWQTGGFDRR
jgi:signal transduction histidine kinase